MYLSVHRYFFMDIQFLFTILFEIVNLKSAILSGSDRWNLATSTSNPKVVSILFYVYLVFNIGRVTFSLIF